MVHDLSSYGRWTPEEMEEYRVNVKRIELENLTKQYDAWCDNHYYIPKMYQPGEFLKKRGILA